LPEIIIKGPPHRIPDGGKALVSINGAVWHLPVRKPVQVPQDVVDHLLIGRYQVEVVEESEIKEN
jgi:hypothetical protein